MVEGERKASGTQEGCKGERPPKATAGEIRYRIEMGKWIPRPRDVTDSNKKWQQRQHSPP